MPSAYDSILGHQRPIEQLERARRLGRVAHAYLFQGPEGVGKERVAFAFAKALNCQNPDRAPCDACDSCQRIDRGCHPDVRLVASEEELVRRGLIEPEKGRSPSRQIRTGQLDELAGLFRHRPYLGRWKAVVLVDAERMNTSSQNRFLKTLEEPTDSSVIMLVTAHPDALLPTVRSRCQVVFLGPLGRDDIAAHLEAQQGVDRERAFILAAMAQGSLGRAEMLADSGFLALRDEVVGLLSRIRQGDLADLLSAAGELGEGRDARQRVGDAVGLMEMWCRDLLVLCLCGTAGRERLVNRDRDARLAEEAEHAKPRMLLRWISQIRRTRSALDTNANPRSMIESLLLQMRTATR
ncbi:MAG: DNA polymerase III subunit delta' [Deltaproteobacteria bacterium]|nr:DNA polymerase III subunit delta' [Deltaproteobacteria bacterium]